MCDRFAEWQTCREIRHLDQSPLRDREREREKLLRSKHFIPSENPSIVSGADGSLGGIWASAELISPRGPTGRLARCSILNHHNSCWLVGIKHQLRLILKLLASYNMNPPHLPP